MITRVQDDGKEKKRVMRKVRPKFLSKKEEDNKNVVAILPKNVNPLSTHMINGAWGLIEKDRKIGFGIRYLNSVLRIDNVQIEDHLNSKQVILKGHKFDQAFVVPWGYSVERLKSYGDLDLATWAWKIESFCNTAPRMMDDYFKVLENADQEEILNLKKIQKDIQKYKAKLESRYPYKAVTILHDNNGVSLSSITFSEAILKLIDETTEDFAKWARVNGIPALFDGHSQFHLSIGKGLLTQSVPLIGGIDEGPEIETFIYDMKGSKKKVVTQHIRVCEPTPYGVLSSGYVVIKSVVKYGQALMNGEDELDELGVKCVKQEVEEVEEEMNLNET